MGFAGNDIMILADFDTVKIVALVVFALFTIVGKWAKGKKKKEQAIRLRSDEDEEEVVDIDLADFLISPGTAAPPVARPPASAPAPVPAPTLGRPAGAVHRPPPGSPPIQAVPATPVRIAQRSKARPRPVEAPSHPAADRWAEKPRSGPSPAGIALGIRGLLKSDPASIRRAIVVSEILAQPVALREGPDSDRDIQGAI